MSDSFGVCDVCGSFVDSATTGPVLVGRTPVRNILGFEAHCCPACRTRYQVSPVMDLLRALCRTDDTIRDVAALMSSGSATSRYGSAGPLPDVLERTLAVQVGEVRDALAFPIRAGGARQGEYCRLYDALAVAKQRGQWAVYEKVAAELSAMPRIPTR